MHEVRGQGAAPGLVGERLGSCGAEGCDEREANAVLIARELLLGLQHAMGDDHILAGVAVPGRQWNFRASRRLRPDPLTTTVTTQATHGTATVNTDGTISYVANPGSTAADQFAVTISDNGPHVHGLASLLGLLTGQNPHNRTVTINVPENTTVPTNQPPVIDPTHTLAVGTADTVTGAVIVTGLSNIVTDPDGDPVTFTSLDTSIDFDTTNPDTFTWTPTPQTRHNAATPGAPQTTTIIITADDGNNGTVDITVVVPIDPVNTAPQTVPGQSATITNVNLSTGQIDGTIAGIHTDPDGDALVYTTTTPGATINSAGAFTYIPDAQTRHNAAAPGGPQTTTITVTIDDGHGGTTSYNVEVPVVSDNANPTTVPGQSASITNIDTTTGQVDGTIAGVHTDPDDDTLTYGTTTPGATINPDGTFTWTPDAQTRHDAAVPGAPQTTAIAVSIDDGHGGTTTYDIEVPIVPQNGNPAVVPGQAPTIDYVNPATGQVVGSILYTLADPDGDFLSYTTATPGATVTPWGTFTYTPTDEARHNAAVPGATQTAIVTIAANDGHGATVNYDVEVPILPQYEAPSFTVSQPSMSAGGSGITGTITASGRHTSDTPIFTVTDATVTGSNTFTTAKGATLVIDPVAGTYTYTPSVAQLWDASYIAATYDDIHETVTITVDDGHGGTLSETIIVPIDGIDLVGKAIGRTQYAPDGTAYQVTFTRITLPLPTPYETYYVTTITTSGALTTTMLTGVPVDGPQIAPDSTAYQTTITGDSTTGYTTQIAHITPTGTTTITLAGEPVGGIQFASNGTAYQTSRTGDPTTGYTTHVTNITSGTTTTLTRAPYGDFGHYGGLRVAPDGTAYQTTYTFDTTTGYTYYVTTISSAGTITTATLPGRPASDGVQIAPDGSAYQTTYGTYDPTSGYTTHVTHITPTGATTTTLTGDDYGVVQFAPDGTAYQTTTTGNDATGYTTHITHITPTGTTTTTLAGGPAGGVQFASDGTAYQISTAHGGPYYLTTITTTGTTTTIPLPIHFPETLHGGLQFLPDGTVRQLLDTNGGTRIIVIKRADPTSAG